MRARPAISRSTVRALCGSVLVATLSFGLSRSGAEAEVLPDRELLLERRPHQARPLFQVEEAAEAHELLESAVNADGREAWSEALAFYAQASRLLRERHSVRPSRGLELAIDKVEQERRSSLRLLELLGAGRIPRRKTSAEETRDEDPHLAAGHLLRCKVELVVSTGHPPPGRLAQHARLLLLRASRPSTKPGARVSSTGASQLGEAGAQIERCALEAAVGDRARARLVLARVPRATREQISLAGAMASCRAALGENSEAIRHLVAGFGELEPALWRELYLLEDWNGLRGDPSFESLFSEPGAAAVSKD